MNLCSPMRMPSLLIMMIPVVMEMEMEMETVAMELVEGEGATMGGTAAPKNVLPPSLY